MLTVTDTLYTLDPDGSRSGLNHGKVVAIPTIVPLFVKAGGIFYELNAPAPAAYTDAGGNFTLTLPWPSESFVTSGSLQWQIALPDGTIWQGTVPEGVAGPVSLYTLKTTYSWAVAASPSQVGAVLIDPTTTLGDTLYRGGSGLTRLAIGSAGALLTSTGSAPSWLGPGAAPQVLGMVGAAPGWVTPTGQRIAEALLTTAQAAISFGSIPQTYRHLLLVLQAQAGASSSNPALQFNGDTAANYSWSDIYSSGTSVVTSSAASATALICGYGGTSNTAPSVAFVIIHNYAQITMYKLASALATNSTPGMALFGGIWKSTAAISSLSIIDSNAQAFQPGTLVSLYGLA